MTAGRPTVSIARCAEYAPATVERAVRESLAPLGGMAAFVSSGQRVFLKVNLLSKAAPDRAVTTHPEVVRAVIRLVREAGGEPRVGDSPGGPNTPGIVRGIFAASGIGRVCDDEGVPLLLLDDEPIRVENPRHALYGAFTLGREAVIADVVITLPKFKTHGFMMFTGAVKNLFGCIPGLEKAQLHLKVPERADFGDMLVDLMLAVRPALAIMDAVVGMEGEGPSGGSPRQVGAVMASADSVALDVVASAMAGLDPMEVYTNRAAAARGLGPGSIDDVRIAGAPWRELAPVGFKLPARDVSASLPPWLRTRLRDAVIARPYVEQPRACTSCGICADVCPVWAVVVDGLPSFDLGRCIRCYCCQELCPTQAIGLKTPILARLADPRRRVR